MVEIILAVLGLIIAIGWGIYETYQSNRLSKQNQNLIILNEDTNKKVQFVEEELNFIKSQLNSLEKTIISSEALNAYPQQKQELEVSIEGLTNTTAELLGKLKEGHHNDG